VFKRMFWLALGLGLGFGISFWAVRMVRQTVARYSPERLSSDLTSALRNLGRDIREAIAEGREAMRERELELLEGTGKAIR
jgi:hypothetical protein